MSSFHNLRHRFLLFQAVRTVSRTVAPTWTGGVKLTISGRMRALQIYPEVALAVLDVNETTTKLTLDGIDDNRRYLNRS